MQDFYLIEKMAHFNRERIPERVVHAKGSGAYGTFTVTNDITQYTKAKLFSQVGKQTEVLLQCKVYHSSSLSGSWYTLPRLIRFMAKALPKHL